MWKVSLLKLENHKLVLVVINLLILAYLICKFYNNVNICLKYCIYLNKNNLYRDANGAVLVYDITDADSFTKVKNWVKELRKMLGNDISLVIAGNKIDLEKQRHVSHQQAEE